MKPLKSQSLWRMAATASANQLILTRPTCVFEVGNGAIQVLQLRLLHGQPPELLPCMANGQISLIFPDMSLE